MEEDFDYIIVGAGSAGCVLANKLSENEKNTVLLIEAGGKDTNLFIDMPSLVFAWSLFFRPIASS